jgi:hypothetical protein
MNFAKFMMAMRANGARKTRATDTARYLSCACANQILLLGTIRSKLTKSDQKLTETEENRAKQGWFLRRNLD